MPTSSMPTSSMPTADSDAEYATSTFAAKRALRKTIKSSLSALTPDVKRSQSARVCRTVLDRGALNLIDSLPSSSAICLYLACDQLNEVDAGEILEHVFSSREDLRVYLPRVLDRDSNMHFLRVYGHDRYDVVPPFGIREPTLVGRDGVAREDVLGEAGLAVVFMPGLGFGKGGERLGRGGGYYDKFLEGWRAGVGGGGGGGGREGRGRPLLVGLAFDEQVVEEGVVPMDGHDCWLDVVVSASAVYDLRGSRESRESRES